MVLGPNLLYAQWVGGRIISVEDETLGKLKKSRRNKRWYLRWWAWCLWVLLCLILTFAAISLWAWTQRYDLMEDWVISKLDEYGIEADLDIVSVTQTSAEIKNIQLQRGGQEFLTVETLRAGYIWPDIRDRKIKRIDLEGVTGQLALNEAWRPQDWITALLPEEANSNPDSVSLFPENGIGLKDATLKLTSPLGKSTLYIDADIPTSMDFSAEITLAPSELTYGGYAAKGAGFVTLERGANKLRVIGQAQTETLSNKNLEFTEAHLQIDGTLNLESYAYVGGVSLDGDSLASELFASGPAHIAWDGEVSPRGDLQASGTWTLTAENARSPRPVRAKEVAEKLSLAPALMNVPVTEHYAPHLQETVLGFVMGSDIAGQGRLDYDSNGFTVNPVGEFKVKSDKNEISLSARTSENFYTFDQAAGLITSQMNAAFQAPVGLKLTNIKLQAASDNGLRLNGVQKFEAGLSTQADWNVTDIEGRPARLGPLQAQFQYHATNNPRRISVQTALDYDGALPGGYVEGLTLEGRLNARLYDARQELDFTPKRGSLINLKSLETPTNWTGEDISFSLPQTENFFIRTPKQSTLSAMLNSAKFTLTQPANQTAGPQKLDIESESMDLNGTVHPDETQSWEIKFGNVNYSSETLPGPGTTGQAETADLTAHLTPNQPPKIELRSPSIIAQSPQVRLSDLDVSLKGTPDAYAIQHNGGSISVIGSDFADTAKAAGLGSFPANGTINFSDDTFRGQANLRVAKANDAEVNVDYTYSNGAGVMEVDIPSILFEPKGLQPQNLVPAFQGKIARVDGEARAKLNIAFTDGTITSSSGTLNLIDLENKSIIAMDGMVEKPALKDAPSNLKITGRYILQPELMGLLKDQAAGAGGEIQLTDAMARLMQTQDFHAFVYEGQDYDCGSKLGYFEAVMAYAKSHPEIGSGVRDLISQSAKQE